MRILRWFAFALIGLALGCVIGAWYVVWDKYQTDVKNARFVWGRDAVVPAFDPTKLVDPETMPENAQVWYTLALVAAVPGLLCLLVSFVAPKKRNASNSKTSIDDSKW